VLLQEVVSKGDVGPHVLSNEVVDGLFSDILLLLCVFVSYLDFVALPTDGLGISNLVTASTSDINALSFLTVGSDGDTSRYNLHQLQEIALRM